MLGNLLKKNGNIMEFCHYGKVGTLRIESKTFSCRLIESKWTIVTVINVFLC